MKTSDIPKLRHSTGGNYILIAGPCVIEDKAETNYLALELARLAERYRIPLIFKGSFRKANRSRLDSFTGIGDEKALKILNEIGKGFGIPVTTDIHLPEEAAMAAEYVDILQIPAFLCRQTDLLVAAGKTGKTVNIKKGQFMSPAAMKHAIDKVEQSGGKRILLTERGTTFGYQDLVVDFRSIPEMKQFNYPVIVDVTHSLQQPNQIEGVTAGRPEYIETLARAAVAAGADGLFMEVHMKPEQAQSDGANMLPFHRLERLLIKLDRIRQAIK